MAVRALHRGLQRLLLAPDLWLTTYPRASLSFQSLLERRDVANHVMQRLLVASRVNSLGVVLDLLPCRLGLNPLCWFHRFESRFQAGARH